MISKDQCKVRSLVSLMLVASSSLGSMSWRTTRRNSMKCLEITLWALELPGATDCFYSWVDFQHGRDCNRLLVNSMDSQIKPMQDNLQTCHRAYRRCFWVCGACVIVRVFPDWCMVQKTLHGLHVGDEFGYHHFITLALEMCSSDVFLSTQLLKANSRCSKESFDILGMSRVTTVQLCPPFGSCEACC